MQTSSLMATPSGLGIARPEVTLSDLSAQASSLQDVVGGTHITGGFIPVVPNPTLDTVVGVGPSSQNTDGIPPPRDHGGALSTSGVVEGKPTSLGHSGGAPTPLE